MEPQSSIDDQQNAIKIANLTKTFKLPHEKQSSLKSSLINFHKRGYDLQEALKDVGFEVKKGEFFGIVGRNGSGKSTLLKTLAGIYAPDGGSIEVRGSLVPFIELGVGFNPELTGRENVFLNGALLGFNRKEMQRMYKDIVDFAEIERFMDQKLKNYSSGMQVRLAFSIAIRAHGDILLLDEVLAVGDAAFQQKCYDYFNSLKREKRTIILVSHNMPVIEQYCDRALLLDQGKIKKIGPSEEIAAMYDEMFIREEAERIRQERLSSEKRSEPGGQDITIEKIRLYQDSKEAKALEAKKSFEVRVLVKSKHDFPEANVGINIKNRDKLMVISTDTMTVIGNVSLKKNRVFEVSFNIDNILTNGLYYINAGVADWSEAAPKVLARKEKALEFTIAGVDKHAEALVQPKIRVRAG
ncbi:MAG TPA: ABC transporter ATP-binding protein [Candidatus Saccharimonadales bacterium]|nr:ABC transporter ATP-binding protein [Candidatus Saccharimonadales bacterium]